MTAGTQDTASSARIEVEQPLKTTLPSEKSHRKRKRVLAVIGAAIAVSILFLLLALGAGWIGGQSAPPKVTVANVQSQVDGVSDCIATISYILRNEGNVKAYVDIDYLDNGWVVAHDFYVMQANSERFAEYSIEHVDCAIQHNYGVRIAAVS